MVVPYPYPNNWYYSFWSLAWQPYWRNKSQPLAMDTSVITTMKNAAKRDINCELQNSVNHRNFERTQRSWIFSLSMPLWVSVTQIWFLIKEGWKPVTSSNYQENGSPLKKGLFNNYSSLMCKSIFTLLMNKVFVKDIHVAEYSIISLFHVLCIEINVKWVVTLFLFRARWAVLWCHIWEHDYPVLNFFCIYHG